MAEFRSEVVRGPIDHNAIIEVYISDEAIPMWSPVIAVAPGTGEDLCRIEPINSASSVDVIGVAVGGEQGDETTSNAASAAGKKVRVVTYGKAKCKVNGNSVNIAIGDGLVTTTTDGRAVKVDYSSADNAAGNVNAAIKALGAVFAKALQTSTADADIIAVFVRQSVGDTA